MENPFIFNMPAKDDQLIRQKWLEDRITRKLLSGQSFTLISPKGWGKKTLVIHMGKIITASHYNYRICHLDLMGVFSEENFIETYANALTQTFDLYFLLENKFELRELLDLSEYLAINHGSKLIICIGNFHMILKFKDPDFFLRKLRSRILTHKNCSYCFYGNHKQISSFIKDQPNKLHHPINQLLTLPRIPLHQWIVFIQTQFEKSGKTITEKAAKCIASRANCLAYYVQLLAWHAWIRTESNCTIGIVDKAMIHLAELFCLHYQTLCQNLTEKQIFFLRALLDYDERLSSRKVLVEFNLCSSAHVTRLRTSLINKGIVYSDYAGTFLLDPIYEFWLKKFYFSQEARN